MLKFVSLLFRAADESGLIFVLPPDKEVSKTEFFPGYYVNNEEAESRVEHICYDNGSVMSKYYLDNRLEAVSWKAHAAQLAACGKNPVTLCQPSP